MLSFVLLTYHYVVDSAKKILYKPDTVYDNNDDYDDDNDDDNNNNNNNISISGEGNQHLTVWNWSELCSYSLTITALPSLWYKRELSDQYKLLFNLSTVHVLWFAGDLVIFKGIWRTQNVQNIHIYKNMDVSLTVRWHVVLNWSLSEFCDYWVVTCPVKNNYCFTTSFTANCSLTFGDYYGTGGLFSYLKGLSLNKKNWLL